MKTLFTKSLLASLVVGGVMFCNVVNAGVAVIVHPSNSTGDLTEEQLKRIFLGKESKFPNGEQAVPIDQAPGSTARDGFYTNVIKKTESQLKSYWSRIIFTGKGQPPRQEANDAAVKALISKNPNLVGYIDDTKVDGSVKVVMSVK